MADVPKTRLEWECVGEDDLGDIYRLALYAPKEVLDKLLTPEIQARVATIRLLGKYDIDDPMHLSVDGDHIVFVRYHSSEVFSGLMQIPEARKVLDETLAGDKAYQLFIDHYGPLQAQQANPDGPSHSSKPSGEKAAAEKMQINWSMATRQDGLFPPISDYEKTHNNGGAIYAVRGVTQAQLALLEKQGLVVSNDINKMSSGVLFLNTENPPLGAVGVLYAYKHDLDTKLGAEVSRVSGVAKAGAAPDLITRI